MNRPWHGLALGLACAALVVLAGCASRSGGGYYKDDGPGNHIPKDIQAIPDAVPRIEHPAPANFRPYEVFGVRYQPLAENQPYLRAGVASWYGRKFHGENTANGETYDMYAMTAAHPTLPIPSYARVTRVATGRSVIVRINDRGPFLNDRIIDLSYVAAAKLGLVGPGSGDVVVQAITNDDIRAGRIPGPTRYASVASAAQAMPAATAEPIAVPRPAPIATVAAAAPPPPPMAPSAPAQAAAGGIYLQFGAFASADNAQALAQRINARANVLPRVSYQASLYKVRLGPYASRDEAAQAATMLAQSAGMNAAIALDSGL